MREMKLQDLKSKSPPELLAFAEEQEVGFNGLLALGDRDTGQGMALALYDSPEAYARLMDALYSDKPLIRKPTDPIWITGLSAGYDQDYSALAVPLRVGDQPYGVITLAHSTPGRYGHEAQAMTTTFASYAAVAIENARLYDTAQEQAYASAALLQVAQVLPAQQ